MYTWHSLSRKVHLQTHSNYAGKDILRSHGTFESSLNVTHLLQVFGSSQLKENVKSKWVI